MTKTTISSSNNNIINNINIDIDIRIRIKININNIINNIVNDNIKRQYHIINNINNIKQQYYSIIKKFGIYRCQQIDDS